MKKQQAMNLFNDTCLLMKKYMKHEQPQKFASMWVTYKRLLRECEYYDIEIPDTTDISNYAEKENIERYGFQK